MEQVSGPQLEEWAAEARERWNVPGLTVGVLREGEIVTAASGLCELGRPETVTPDTVFRIASITKPFVGTLTMTLVQEGLLALDEPPPGTAVDATVRQLLSHQGGFASEWPEPLDTMGDEDDSLLRLAGLEPERLLIGPGELFSYCNAGYWLVGAAIVRLLGTSFEEAMRDRVLEPLGLRATGFEPEAAARGHNQVEPGADEHKPADDKYPRVRRPSGGLWSTVPDLLRIAEHHLGEPGPLTAASIAEMQRPLVSGPGCRYGLGWFLTELRGRPAVEHPGSAAGYQSLLLLLPGQRIAFAALSNSSRGSAAIRDVLVHLGLAAQEEPEVELEDLTAFAGRYRGQGVEIEVVPQNGRLRVEFTEIDPFSGQAQIYPSMLARAVGEREFEVVDGEWRGDRFDFPRAGFVCIGPLATLVE